MHHLTCGISSLLHSVNLILFTVVLVHVILHISPHLKSMTYADRLRYLDIPSLEFLRLHVWFGGFKSV